MQRRNFDYYDPITTGDSSLSACVQATAAAQIGYDNLAVDYFREALYVDLADLHGNTADGVHVASCGGVWGTVVFGFAGVFETGTALSFEPSLPDAWESISFHMQRHGSRMRVELDADGCTVHVLDGDPVPIHARPGETGPLLDPHLRPTDDVGDGSGADRSRRHRDGAPRRPPARAEGDLPPVLTRRLSRHLVTLRLNRPIWSPTFSISRTQSDQIGHRRRKIGARGGGGR